MMKSFDVIALGELLIDFTENGTSTQGNPMMEANPGGAPCNVLSMLNRLGHSTAYIGKVGDDQFGRQLAEAAREVGICLDGLICDPSIHTTLAFVHTAPDGDRDFSFYRNPGADMMLRKEEINCELIRGSKLFHFGSLSMTAEPVRGATQKAVACAKDAGCIISFDPNLREPLWNNLDEAREQIRYGIGCCDILKISDNEIEWFTGREDYDEAAAALLDEFPNLKLLLVSLGRDGSRAYQATSRVEVAPFLQEHTIETTGAGDTFCAGILHFVLEHGLRTYTDEELRSMLTFANAAASIVTTRKGALRVMPSKDEVEELLAAQQEEGRLWQGR